MVFDKQLRSGAITEPPAVASGMKTERAKEMSLESFSIAPTGGSCVPISLATARCSVTSLLHGQATSQLRSTHPLPQVVLTCGRLLWFPLLDLTSNFA